MQINQLKLKANHALLLAAGSGIVFSMACHSQVTNMSFDSQRTSGLAQVQNLQERVRNTSDTNALTKLCVLVEDSKLGPKAAGALAGVASSLSNSQIELLVIPSLAKGLDSPNASTRRECAIALSNQYVSFAKPAIPALLRRLRDPADAVNATPFAVEALGKIGPAAAVGIPDLLRILSQPEMTSMSDGEQFSIRVLAVEAIGRIDLKDIKTRESVQKALTDTNKYVRVKCAEALLRNNCAFEQAVSTLSQLLESDDIAVRRFTFNTVEGLVPVPDTLVHSIQKITEDDDTALATTARALLTRIKSGEGK